MKRTVGKGYIKKKLPVYFRSVTCNLKYYLILCFHLAATDFKLFAPMILKLVHG